MAFENISSPDSPVEQRKLLIAASDLTRALAEYGHAAASIAREATAESVLYIIWLRLLQMARSIQSSCYLGYAHEQQGIARGMVNAASDLMFIASRSDPTSWAMLYALYSIERRKRIGKGFVKAGVMSQEQFDQWDQEQDKIEAKVMKEADGKGIRTAEKHKPSKKSGSSKEPQSAPTWSGYTDADLIGTTGRNWYAAYYVPFSDVTHANVMSAETELTQLRAGQVEVGPRFPDVILMQVIGAMADTMTSAAETINRHFKLNKEKEIAQQERAMLKAIQEYRASLPSASQAQPVKEPQPSDSSLPSKG